MGGETHCPCDIYDLTILCDVLPMTVFLIASRKITSHLTRGLGRLLVSNRFPVGNKRIIESKVSRFSSVLFKALYFTITCLSLYPHLIVELSWWPAELGGTGGDGTVEGGLFGHKYSVLGFSYHLHS